MASRPSSAGLPSREDCWSEGETSVLIDAWGDRYLETNRGNLRQKHWQEVADAVNSRPCDARRPPRTDVQCKNRVDTLKKKYKIERNKEIKQWMFYERMHFLVGNVPVKKSPIYMPPLALPLPEGRKGGPLPIAKAMAPLNETNLYYNNNNSYDDLESSGSEEVLYRKRVISGKKEKEEDESGGVVEILSAIGKLAEIYEKVEMEKGKQMIELEKQRIEFAKSVEIQRMQMAVDMQVKVMKMKRAKRKIDDRYL